MNSQMHAAGGERTVILECDGETQLQASQAYMRVIKAHDRWLYWRVASVSSWALLSSDVCRRSSMRPIFPRAVSSMKPTSPGAVPHRSWGSCIPHVFQIWVFLLYWPPPSNALYCIDPHPPRHWPPPFKFVAPPLHLPLVPVPMRKCKNRLLQYIFDAICMCQKMCV